jgi:hypothetical protein
MPAAKIISAADRKSRCLPPSYSSYPFALEILHFARETTAEVMSYVAYPAAAAPACPELSFSTCKDTANPLPGMTSSPHLPAPSFDFYSYGSVQIYLQSCYRTHSASEKFQARHAKPHYAT